MTYKTILVHVGVDPEATPRLKAALSIGAPCGATVIGMGAFSWDPIDPALAYVDGETIQALRDDVEADIAVSQAAFKTTCAGYAHPVIWRSSMQYPSQAMTVQSRCADLIVASHPQKGFDARYFPAPADLVMQSGLPVLLMPPGQEEIHPRRIVIGWKNTREARRAIADALPLLKAANDVYLVQVAEPLGSDDSELKDVVDRLDRHGVEAQASIVPQLKVTAAAELMAVAKSRSADLVVLGAYGHSKLREWAFGGVTADLLASAPTPILFSH